MQGKNKDKTGLKMVVGQCAKFLALLNDLLAWSSQAFNAISGWDPELFLATEVLPFCLCEVPSSTWQSMLPMLPADVYK